MRNAPRSSTQQPATKTSSAKTSRGAASNQEPDTENQNQNQNQLHPAARGCWISLLTAGCLRLRGQVAAVQREFMQREFHRFHSPLRTRSSGRRPGEHAKRACVGAGRQLWTGRREKTAHPSIAIMKGCRYPRFSLPKCHFHPDLPVFLGLGDINGIY